MEKIKEVDENGNEKRVMHLIDMHLNAAFVEKTDKMAVDIALMMCQVRDVACAAREGITDLDSFERSLVFANLAELRKNVNSVLNAINDLSVKTMAWSEKRCVQVPTPAKSKVDSKS